MLQLLSRFLQTIDQTHHGNCVDLVVPEGVTLVVVGDLHGQMQVGGRL